jgi:hypothetical protein
MYSDLLAWPYTAAFVQVWEYNRPPYAPGIVASIDFGPIRDLEWGRDCDGYCLPPPPMFCVLVDWASPAEPNCWVLVAGGVAGGVYMGTLTFGSCELRYIDAEKVDLPGVCTQGVHPGWNRYAIWAGPLRSGKYRLRLYCFNYPDFHFGLGSCPPHKPNYWQYAGTPYITDEATIEVKENCYDFSKITSVFYLANNGTHRVYGNQVLNVLTPYHCVAVLTSTQDAQTIPREIYARLRIDSISAPHPFKFVRWPQADRGSCDTNYMIKHYYYISQNEIIPKDYFDLSPEEWSNVSKVLECDIFGEHSMLANFNDTSIANHIVARLYLDYMNDSTGCFIPVKGDTAYFRFMFSDSVGLDSTSLVYFNIEDRNGDSVYLSPISITDIHFDTTIFNLPGINAAVIPITWNGRYNVGEHNGHFADPENDPYLAYISVNPRSGNPMYSNADTANVVPKLDSVIVTHRPSWPPPVFNDSVRIYSIIYAKIDDIGDSISNHRYYYRAEQESVYYIDINCNNQYIYRSLDGVGFVEDNNALTIMPAFWKSDYWGTIDYQWTVVRDSANKIGTQAIYYYSKDTTEQWGNIWNPRVVHNVHNGHWRIYIKSKVTNKKGSRLLQEKTSPNTSKAHKLIFGPSQAEPWNVCDYAETHLGVPYWIGGNRTKKPYSWIDCSGFVTAVKIQDRGLLQDNVYSLNEIGVCHYVDTFYKHGARVITISKKIKESQVLPGDIIAMKNINEPKKGYSHIVLVEYCRFKNSKIEQAKIIHAHGSSNSERRRVRRDDNLLSTFAPSDGYRFKYRRFAD